MATYHNLFNQIKSVLSAFSGVGYNKIDKRAITDIFMLSEEGNLFLL